MPIAAELRAGVLANPHRTRRLMHDAIKRLRLDLSDLCVYTEAGTGAYAATPVLAALAGAEHVWAITRDTMYGSAESVRQLTEELICSCRTRPVVEVVTEKRGSDLAAADIITNLGHVRPIDAALVSKLDMGRAVVPLMYEAWEVRPGDVDIDACRRAGIPVMGTNEDHPDVDCFRSCGQLAIKMLHEAGIEVRKCRIGVVSPDRFGEVIAPVLEASEAEVHLSTNIGAGLLEFLASADALIVADYAAQDTLIGSQGRISAKELAKASPGLVVVQFAGDVDVEDVRSAGLVVHPEERIGCSRMGRTLAHLGPKPVIDLHAAGLKVGEAMARARRTGLAGEPLHDEVACCSPAQAISEEASR